MSIVISEQESVRLGQGLRGDTYYLHNSSAVVQVHACVSVGTLPEAVRPMLTQWFATQNVSVQDVY